MKSMDFIRSMGGIDDDIIMETAAAMYGAAGSARNGGARTYRRSYRRIIALAAALAALLALGAAAYATDFFGLRAMRVEPERATYIPYKIEEKPDGTREAVPNPDGAVVSLTQPQDAPEDIPPEVRERIENSRRAWDEWLAWNEELNPTVEFPQVYETPSRVRLKSEEQNPDGTYNLTFERVTPVYDESGTKLLDFEFEEVETRTATAAEHEQMNRYIAQQIKWSRASFPGYDFNYHVMDEAAAAKLEEIAAKYGLNLRHENTLLFSGETRRAMDEKLNLPHQALDEDRTNQELADIITEKFCTAPFFYIVPSGFDKLYYYDEGTFCVCFYAAPGDAVGDKVSCYAYNSPYSTLSSGDEVNSEINDVSAVVTRTHTAPDGTELTVMRSGNNIDKVFAYVYLEKSYFTVTVHPPRDGSELTDADVDAALDMINYSAINK